MHRYYPCDISLPHSCEANRRGVSSLPSPSRVHPLLAWPTPAPSLVRMVALSCEQGLPLPLCMVLHPADSAESLLNALPLPPISFPFRIKSKLFPVPYEALRDRRPRTSAASSPVDLALILTILDILASLSLTFVGLRGPGTCCSLCLECSTPRLFCGFLSLPTNS